MNDDPLGPLPHVPPPPFAVFDEFGRKSDDRVNAYALAHAVASQAAERKRWATAAWLCIGATPEQLPMALDALRDVYEAYAMPAKVRLTDGLDPLPPPRVLDRHLPTGIALYGYNAEDMRAYAAKQVAAEQDRIRGLLALCSKETADVVGKYLDAAKREQP